ncbi:MAG: HAD-IB family phosphatase [Deltaproteobacteria bacterium]|nr:HAD-IB family phosphatase [Deltaproteobacteria bacterium]
MLERVEEHRRRGDVLVIISASVDYLLEQPFNALSFDHLLCTRLETGPDGLGTGRPVGRVCVGPEKRVRAMEFAAAEGIDLAASTAYADHHSDLALLEAVGHPVAVRPTAPLRRIAQERGWEISDLR